MLHLGKNGSEVLQGEHCAKLHEVSSGVGRFRPWEGSHSATADCRQAVSWVPTSGAALTRRCLGKPDHEHNDAKHCQEMDGAEGDLHCEPEHEPQNEDSDADEFQDAHACLLVVAAACCVTPQGTSIRHCMQQ